MSLSACTLRTPLQLLPSRHTRTSAAKRLLYALSKATTPAHSGYRPLFRSPPGRLPARKHRGARRSADRTMRLSRPLSRLRIHALSRKHHVLHGFSSPLLARCFEVEWKCAVSKNLIPTCRARHARLRSVEGILGMRSCQSISSALYGQTSHLQIKPQTSPVIFQTRSWINAQPQQTLSLRVHIKR